MVSVYRVCTRYSEKQYIPESTPPPKKKKLPPVIIWLFFSVFETLQIYFWLPCSSQPLLPLAFEKTSLLKKTDTIEATKNLILMNGKFKQNTTISTRRLQHKMSWVLALWQKLLAGSWHTQKDILYGQKKEKIFQIINNDIFYCTAALVI